jgi:hypothetical protein
LFSLLGEIFFDAAEEGRLAELILNFFYYLIGFIFSYS